MLLLLPAKFAKVMFLQVSVCPHWGGMCGFIQRGACMVLFGGGMRSFIRGVCMVLFGGGGVHGFIRGCAWFYSGGHAWFYLGGVCVVLFGGHAWFYSGGVCGFFGYNEIRSMSGQYTSYWNAFLFHLIFLCYN